jgi:hypothetical protein
MFFFSIAFTPTEGSTRAPMQWIRVASFLDKKRRGRETNYSPPPNG